MYIIFPYGFQHLTHERQVVLGSVDIVCNVVICSVRRGTLGWPNSETTIGFPYVFQR
jgi:hypothetical protein